MCIGGILKASQGVKFSTILYSTLLLFYTLFHSTILYSTTLLYSTLLYSTLWIFLSCLVLSCLALSCLVLSCLVLSCLPTDINRYIQILQDRYGYTIAFNATEAQHVADNECTRNTRTLHYNTATVQKLHTIREFRGFGVSKKEANWMYVSKFGKVSATSPRRCFLLCECGLF